MTETEKVIIIGAGPAGLTAAIYLARFNLSPLVLTGPAPGGQPMWSGIIDNYPGFPAGTTGPELMQLFFAQAEKFAIPLVAESVTKVEFADGPFRIWTTNLSDDIPNYTARSVIIATGSTAKKLGLPEEDKFIGRGLALCAICDGAFYKNKTVAVVGSGNKALEDALTLAATASQVYLLVRSAAYKADAYLQAQVAKNPRISPIFSQTVVALKGDSRLEKIVLQNTDPALPAHQSELPVDGLFLAIGQLPVTELFVPTIQLNSTQQILTGLAVGPDNPYASGTNVRGIFAAGDCVAGQPAQIVSAAGGGCAAAIDAKNFLASENS